MVDEATDTADEATANAGSGVEAVPYDFTRPSGIPEDQLATVTLISEAFCESIALGLGSLLQADVTSEFQSVEQQSFSEYCMGLAAPTCLAVFDMQPLSGYGVIEVNSALVYPMINRMLGGDGAVPMLARPFTELELAVARKLLRAILRDLGNAWAQVLDLNFSIKELQSNPALVRAIPTRELCVTSSMNVSMGENKGLITVAIPYVNLEPVAGKLGNEDWGARYSVNQPEAIREAHKRNFHAIQVDVVGRLGTVTLTMEDLLMLQSGDVLAIGHKVNQPIDITVAGKRKFLGMPGLVGKHRAMVIQKELGKE